MIDKIFESLGVSAVVAEPVMGVSRASQHTVANNNSDGAKPFCR